MTVFRGGQYVSDSQLLAEILSVLHSLRADVRLLSAPAREAKEAAELARFKERLEREEASRVAWAPFNLDARALKCMVWSGLSPDEVRAMSDEAVLGLHTRNLGPKTMTRVRAALAGELVPA